MTATNFNDYPADAAVWAWVSKVSPAGVRDATLWGFAYAALNGALPASDPSGLGQFQAFQANAYAWVGGTHYWDVDFLLAYIQANGHYPSGPDDFTGWLASQGYATKQGNGSYAKTGKYPTGGLGYPPGGVATSGASATGAAPATTGTGVPVATPGMLAWVEAHPWQTAAGALGALLLLRTLR